MSASLLEFCGVSVIVLGVMLLFERWSRKRLVRRAAADAAGWLNKKREPVRLIPESLYTVEISETGVACHCPDGTTEEVGWADLPKVEILGTDEGPCLPDQFWLLHGSGRGCVIPLGANGGPELMERLQLLPGFRDEGIINAMYRTDNCRFVCWARQSRDA